MAAATGHLHQMSLALVGRQLMEFGDASPSDVESRPREVLARVEPDVPGAQPSDGPWVAASLGLGDVVTARAVGHLPTLPCVRKRRRYQPYGLPPVSERRLDDTPQPAFPSLMAMVVRSGQSP